MIFYHSINDYSWSTAMTKSVLPVEPSKRTLSELPDTWATDRPSNRSQVVAIWVPPKMLIMLNTEADFIVTCELTANENFSYNQVWARFHTVDYSNPGLRIWILVAYSHIATHSTGHACLESYQLLAIYFSLTITKLVQSNIEVHF